MVYDSISNPISQKDYCILSTKLSAKIFKHDVGCANIEGVAYYGLVLSILSDYTRGDGHTNMECKVGCIEGPCP